MKRKPEFPYSVQRGSVTINVYEVTYLKNNVSYTSYRVIWYDANRKAKTKSFTDWQDAIVEAENKATEFSKGELDAVSLTGQERLTYIRARDVLTGFQVPLDVAASRFASALKRLGSLPFEQAIEYAVTHLNPERPSKTVREVLEEMVKAKRADGVTDYRIRDLNVRCGAFADCKAIKELTVEQITLNHVSDYLRALEVEPKTRNHYRGDIVTLFRFAISRGYLSKDCIDLEAIPKAKAIAKRISVYTPDELCGLLKAANVPGEEEILKHLVIGAFAGIRRDERLRLDWSDFDFEENTITLHAHITKTNSRRVVPILPVLREWLLPHAKKAGAVFRKKKTQRCEERISRNTGIVWKKNALRHSFISYRVAETKNVPLVSYETGTLPKTMDRHYRELVKPSSAVKWFSLTPALVARFTPQDAIETLTQPKTLAEAA